MDTSNTLGLRAIGLDVKAVASRRGPDRPHPLLPPQVLALTRYWLSLGGKTPPLWSQFELVEVGSIVPYLTILRCHSDSTFSFTFVGAAVAGVFGDDFMGQTVTAGDPVWGEID